MSEIVTSLAENRVAPRVEPPDMPTLLSRRERALLSRLNCTQLGTIVSFDPAKQTASISINFKRVLVRQPGVAGVGPVSDIYIDYPVLVNCPVVFLFGGGGSLTMPITEGDTCLVFFADRDIDGWFASGQDGPPNSDRLHDLADGIALVGIRSALSPLEDYPTTMVRLAHGNAVAELDDQSKARLALGEDAEVSVEDKILVRVGVQTLKDALTSFVNAVIAAVMTDGSTMNPATQAALNAAKVKIEAVLK